jgi:hypothetical protein
LTHSGRGECAGADIDRLDRGLSIQGAIEKLRTFSDECTVSVARRAALKQTAEALYALMPKAEPNGQGSLPASDAPEVSATAICASVVTPSLFPSELCPSFATATR